MGLLIRPSHIKFLGPFCPTPGIPSSIVTMCHSFDHRTVPSLCGCRGPHIFFTLPLFFCALLTVYDLTDCRGAHDSSVVPMPLCDPLLPSVGHSKDLLPKNRNHDEIDVIVHWLCYSKCNARLVSLPWWLWRQRLTFVGCHEQKYMKQGTRASICSPQGAGWDLWSCC